MKSLGNIIREARQAKNLQLKDVAKALSIDKSLISKYELGTRKPSKYQILKLASYLGLSDRDVIIPWLVDKLLEELVNEEYAYEAFKLAEPQVKYLKSSEVTLYTLLDEIDELKSKLDKFRPLPPAQGANLEQAFNIEYTYESNRIEGNTLTLMETAMVIEKGITIGGKSLREHLEAINHFDAISYINEVIQDKEPLNERLVKDIHAFVLRGIDKENAGRYRSVEVRISGSKHVPPEHFRLTEKMEKYFAYYNLQNKSLHPVLLAADMHEKLVTIHPFIDGNGRTSRLVMNLVLLQSGYTIANISGEKDRRMEYYQALENVQVKGDSTDFHLLIASVVKNNLNEWLKLIH
jgi:Fic family protein